MKAVITGENDERVGVNLLDNNDAEHVIEMEFDGEIKYHEQDGYPDKAANRTPEGNEHVHQARRYARWYVYDQRGYETFRWDENIARIEAVRDAIEVLSTDEFEEYFGEFYDEVAGGVDIESGGGIADIISALQQGPSAYYIDVVLNEEGQIDATSEVNPVIVRDGWEKELDSPQGERVPDARIELPPMPLPSIELFQPVVVHQTNCQIRDYYIVMGEKPPEEYRVLGFGKYKFTAKYRDDRLDRYENYARLDADIPGYTVGLGLEEHPEIEQQVKTILSTFAGQ